MESENFNEDSKRPLLSPYDPEDNHDFKAQGLALKPVEPLTVTWHDVSLAITTKKGRKDILQYLSGQAKWGTVTAVMGPTGSGKSSLLNALAGRVSYSKGAELTGEVKVNGLQMDHKSFSKVSAYVTQDDSLYSFLTVKETLTLSSHFYLPSSMRTEDKAKYVKDVINVLGLAKAVDTIIGDDRVRGVSGGERKRVSVGVELISNPSLLFLDEPTSGLDSFQALSVMGAMRSLARSGRTVISAIHQPRSSIYDMLDVLVLVSEGRTIYAGPTSSASAYFESRGFKCPSNFCPSDYFLDVISTDYRSQELEKRTAGRIKDLADAWETRPLQSEDDHMERHSLDELVKDSLLAAGPDGSYQSSWCTQFIMLFKRSFAQTKRNKFALTVKTVTSVFFALILGAIYSDSGRSGNSHSQRAIQNYIGVTFFVAVNQAFGNIVGVINTFPVEKVTVQKELVGKAYRLSAYYLAKFLSELPFNILGPLLFSTVAYWLVGLRPEATHFLTFIGLCMLEAICAVSLGVVVSAISPDVPAASALAPPITIVFMLFSGLFINVNSLPDGAKWCPYFSFIKWAFQGFAINQFVGFEFECEPGTSEVCNGDQVLEAYSMDNYSLTECVMALVGISVIFVALGYVLLRLNAKKYLQMTAPSHMAIKVDA